MKQLNLFGGEEPGPISRTFWPRLYTAEGGPYHGEKILLSWHGPDTGTAWFSVNGGEVGRYVACREKAVWVPKT